MQYRLYFDAGIIIGTPSRLGAGTEVLKILRDVQPLRVVLSEPCGHVQLWLRHG
jgi:acetyltransferase-like isoleucine patch superfamily enzyme